MPRVRLAAGPLRAGTGHCNRFRSTRGFHPLPGTVLEFLTLSPNRKLTNHNITFFSYTTRTPKRDLPTRTKRKVHAIGGARGVWSLSVRTAVKVNGVPYDRPANPYHAENDSLILGTDAIPSPGFSRVSMSPLSRTAIELMRIWGSLGYATPRGTLRSPLASRALRSVPRHSSKAPPFYMCYQTQSAYSNPVCYIGLLAIPHCKY